MATTKTIKAGTTQRNRGRTTDAAFRKGIMTLPRLVDVPSSPLDRPARADAVPSSPDLSLGRMVETNGGSSLEKVPGFDTARARNAGLFPRATALGAASLGVDGFALENVIGVDNLVPVPDTTSVPWRCVALLSITYEDGIRATGTAWFMSAKALGTAGHNIRHPEHGRATEILVSPAFDGSTAPFGTYRVNQTYCDPAWLNGNTDAGLDFGVLVLDDNSVGLRLGWFGFAAYDDRQLNKLLLNVSGYPMDRVSRTQHYNGGRIDDVDSMFLRYTFDTVGGMSGAPIFALFGEQRVVVGIHTSGNDRSNRARRIDRSLYAILSRFAMA
jgi:V8-like Glu-specific endopeptidase